MLSTSVDEELGSGGLPKASPLFVSVGVGPGSCPHWTLFRCTALCSTEEALVRWFCVAGTWGFFPG